MLRRLLEKREVVLTRLERVELLRRRKGGKEPKMWTGGCLCVGERVNSVAYLTQELSYYNTEVGTSPKNGPVADAVMFNGFFCYHAIHEKWCPIRRTDDTKMNDKQDKGEVLTLECILRNCETCLCVWRAR